MNYLQTLRHDELIDCLRKMQSNCEASGDVAGELTLETAVYRLNAVQDELAKLFPPAMQPKTKDTV